MNVHRYFVSVSVVQSKRTPALRSLQSPWPCPTPPDASPPRPRLGPPTSGFTEGAWSDVGRWSGPCRPVPLLHLPSRLGRGFPTTSGAGSLLVVLHHGPRSRRACTTRLTVPLFRRTSGDWTDPPSFRPVSPPNHGPQPNLPHLLPNLPHPQLNLPHPQPLPHLPVLVNILRLHVESLVNCFIVHRGIHGNMWRSGRFPLSGC